MNYIKIYFALPEELSKERDELADYVRSLNDFYHERDIFFEVNFGGDPFDSFDDFPSTSDEEDNQREDIRESNYFYLIFGCHDDEGIREKFEVALEEFGKNGAPKIYTYFKKLPEGVETEQGIKDFIDRLDQAIGHYYSQFVHIDSVKLNILLELTNISKNGDKLEFEDGHATINGTKVLPLDNIPIYQCNDTLQQLKAEKARLEQEFAGAAVNYAQNPNNQEAFNKMMDLSGERNRVTDKIHEIEKGMLGLCNTISEMRHSDRKLTWREVEAGKRLDMGDYDGALMILRDDQREKELAQAETIANEGIERIRGYIAENRMIISTLKTKGVSVDTLDELHSRYEKNTELAKEYHIELDCVYNHINFLYDQKEFSRAIALADWLKPFYKENVKIVGLLNLLGMCYQELHDFQQSKYYYELSMDISLKLAGEDPEAFENYVAVSGNNLAGLYENIHLYEDSEYLGRKVLEINRRLAKRNPEVYECDVATVCNNLAGLQHKLHKYEESEALYREALEIRRRLARGNSEEYEYDLSTTCYDLAFLLNDLQQYEEAVKLYYEAWEIRRKLAQRNPVAYENDEADTGNDLAVLLHHLHRYKESYMVYHDTLEIYRKLAQKNPKSYESDLAYTCFNFAVMLRETHRFGKSEMLFCEAMDIFMKLAKIQPDEYKEKVALTYFNLAYLMIDVSQYQQAAQFYRKSLVIYWELAIENPEIYESDAALTCYNLACLLYNMHEYEESGGLFLRALDFYKSLSERDPDAYEPVCAHIEEIILKIEAM